MAERAPSGALGLFMSAYSSQPLHRLLCIRRPCGRTTLALIALIAPTLPPLPLESEQHSGDGRTAEQKTHHNRPP